MVFVCSANHPLASEKKVTADAIAQQKFVAFDRTLSIRRAVDRALRAPSGSDPELVLFVDSGPTEAIVLRVLAGSRVRPEPWLSRCVHCGDPLEGDPSVVGSRLARGTRVTDGEDPWVVARRVVAREPTPVLWCVRCDHPFWEGSHGPRIRRRLIVRYAPRAGHPGSLDRCSFADAEVERLLDHGA